MNVDQKNKNWLTPLLRWLSGEANRHDEQSLDKLAKDDPFLADALEGYRSLPEADHVAAMTRLKANLRRRARRQRGAGFYLLRVAAVGAVLVAAWFVFQQFSQQEKSQAGMAETARTEQPAGDTGTAGQTSPSAIAQESEEVGSMAALEEKAAASQDFTEKKSVPSARLRAKEEEAANETLAEPARPEALADAPAEPGVSAFDTIAPSAESDDLPAVKEELSEAKMRVTEEEKSAAPPAVKSKKTDAAPAAADNFVSAAPGRTDQPRQITGLVTDGAGERLIGVSIQAKGTATGAVTGIDGVYSINVPAGVSALVFSYTGFANLEVQLGGENRLDVQLEEGGEMLSEVVVTGYGQAKQRQVVSPKPKGGFKKFEKYLRENMRRPDATANGAVMVRFRILADGTLTDFQTTSTLGQPFRDEAVRLLRDGPKWKGEPGVFAAYTVRFE